MPGTALGAQLLQILQSNHPPRPPPLWARPAVIPLPWAFHWLPALTWLTPFSTRMGGISVKVKQASWLPCLKCPRGCPLGSTKSNSSSPPAQVLQELDQLINPTWSPPASLPPWCFSASWQAYSSPGVFALAAPSRGWSSLLQVSAGMGAGLQLSCLIGGCPTPSLSSRRSL